MISEQKSKKVVVLGTGGTIAGRASCASDNIGYTAAQVGVADLLASVPGLDAVLAGHRLHSEQVAQVDSKDMGFALWQALASRISDHLAQPDVTGVVITHGTDTLEETAYFLHAVLPLALQNSKPVVLTCAMRPATALSPDGPQNLLDAVWRCAPGWFTARSMCKKTTPTGLMHLAPVMRACSGMLKRPNSDLQEIGL